MQFSISENLQNYLMQKYETGRSTKENIYVFFKVLIINSIFNKC